MISPQYQLVLRGFVLALAAGAVTGCAGALTAPAAGSARPSVLVGERPLPYPVTESPEFRRAVERGTRTRSGEPGPEYWQQFAEYTLRAELDPRTTRLRGTGTVRYHNRSPDSLSVIVVHLYQNIHAPDAERNDRVPVTEPVRLTRVVLDGELLAPLDTSDTSGVGYRVYGTVATLRPSRAIPARTSATLTFAWSFPVPPTPNIRMGQDGEVFHLAFWYPQIAVYDDINGWDTEQYLGDAEFYMGYADYDVSVTVPAGWIVSATGELTNPSDVLPGAIRQRLARARHSDEVVNVVAARERAPGVSTARGNRLTWRFRAENVRDFAWNASNRYVWDATRAVIQSATGEDALDTVLIHALYRPGTVPWDQAAEFARHSVEFLSRALWSYPYPQMTLVEGIITGGMEFPMITLIGAGRTAYTVRTLYSVTVHEIAHMWFPMQVGSNERQFTWMDEGLARFNQLDAMEDFFSGVPRDSLRADTYLPLARTGREVELMRHGDQYDFEGARRVAGYDKPAKVLHALRALLGEENFLRAYREYGRRWVNRHPQPWDLFNTFNTVTDQPLDWFWRSWFYETWVLDQAIGPVTPRWGDLLVTVEDRGLVPMPAWLAITRENGSVERVDVPVDVWLAGHRSYTVRVPGEATVRSIEIDPGGVFPDVDRRNQRWTR